MKRKKKAEKFDKRILEKLQCFIDLLIEMRHLCKLSQETASDILHIERSLLTRYENQNICMSFTRYLDMHDSYYHYMVSQNIEVSDKMRKLQELCNRF